MEKKQYPYQILFKDRPYASEFEFQLEIDLADDEMKWWEQFDADGVIYEVTEILNRYTPGSGWVHAEEIEEGSENAIQERNEMRELVKHMKKQKKKFFK